MFVSASSIIDDWIAEMDEHGVDSAALYQEAQAMIAKHAGT